MKVCMVATDFPVKRGNGPVTYGGAGACMAQLVDGLIREGVDVSVVTRRERGEYSELFDIPVYRTGYFGVGFFEREFKMTHSICVVPKLLEVCRKEKFDVLHSHNPPAAFPGNLAGRKYGVKHVTTMHGPWAGVRLNRVSRFLCRQFERRTLRDADYVTCDSKKLSEDVVRWHNLDESKVTAIPNAVETDRFTPELASKKEARAKLGIKSDGRLVLYTGRFLVEKGVTFLLDAVEEVVGEVKDASFLLIGGGFDEKIVSRRLSKTKARNKVITIPYVEYEKMPYAYIASDVLVQPSLAEGQSRSILEAMACGLPVVATDVGGNPELVSKENGVLVKPASGQEIARALVGLLSDERKLARLGEGSRRRAVSDFSVDKRIKSFVRLYEGLS